MAQIQKGTTYSTGDQVTATNLNALADAAILLPGAITDQTAKTVPLAADTVLIHSAADTALRKSTLTQLFANATGIPISTGISGLGTGIATALAINTGTTGAPALLGAAGAFTTLSTSGNATLGDVPSADTHTVNGITTVNFDLNGVGKLVLNNQNVGAASSSALVFGDTGTERWKWASYRDGTGQIRLSIVGGSDILNVSSTGLAVTGALSASGSITGTGNSLLNYGGGNVYWQFESANNYVGRKSDGDVWLNVAAGYSVKLGYAGSAIATASSTGLAVTGTLSTTGNVTLSSGVSLRIFNAANNDDGIWYNTGGSGVSILTARISGVDRVNISSTGLAVTGALSASGQIAANGGVALEGQALTWNQSGVRSWSMTTATSSGNLSLNSGDTSGTFRVNMPLAVTGALSSTSNAELATTGGGSFVKIGSSTAIGSGTGLLEITFNNAYYGQRVKTSNSGGGSVLQILKSTGTEVGLISHNDTVTVYGGTSDYRLKDITGPLIDSGTFIDALKPKVGTWKSNGDKFVGFLAHEFAEVSPSSVVGEKDAVDAEGNPKYQGMQASSAEVIANLVAELQSLRQRVAALESN